MHYFLSALLPLALGAVGWLVLEFLGRPVRQFFDIRRETKRRMLLHWDAPIILHASDISPSGDPKREEAMAAFAELSAQLIAFDKSESVAAWLIRKMGYDAASAGKALQAISIEAGTIQEDRDKTFPRVDKALKFRISTTTVFYDPRR